MAVQIDTIIRAIILASLMTKLSFSIQPLSANLSNFASMVMPYANAVTGTLMLNLRISPEAVLPIGAVLEKSLVKALPLNLITVEL